MMTALQLMVWALPPVADTDKPGISYLADPKLWGALLTLAACAWTGLRTRGRGFVSPRFMWIFIWLLHSEPDAAAQRYFSYVFLNERYLYLSSAGFFLLASSAIDNAAAAWRG